MSNLQKIFFSSACVILLITACFIVFNDKGLLDRAEMMKELAVITAKNDKIKSENKNLYVEIDKLQNDVDYIEREARHTLNMIAEDEFVIKFH